jgi:hypothetical protein
MTALNSVFDIITRDPHPNALASLMVILDVNSPPAVTDPGTPSPGTTVPGMIVEMNVAGKLIPGDQAGHAAATPKMYLVAVDGDVDYDGAFLHKVTCLEGGLEMKTDQYVAGVYNPGDPLTVDTGANVGKLLKLTGAGEPLLGFVGPDGINSDGTLDVIMPQGRGR